MRFFELGLSALCSRWILPKLSAPFCVRNAVNNLNDLRLLPAAELVTELSAEIAVADTEDIGDLPKPYATEFSVSSYVDI